MGFRGATRGQSEVVGAILIFAIIVAFIGINQAFLVPQANEDVEFKHSNDVQRDMVNLRSGLIEAAGSNEPRSRSVALGTDYPSRFIAINPPAPTGTLRTTEADGRYTSTGKEVNGTDMVSRACDTVGTSNNPRFVEYQPNYNEFGNALPVRVDNTITYRRTPDKQLVDTGQTLVQGDQINLIRVIGDVEETSSETVSIDLIPSNTGVRTFYVDEDEQFDLTIPTRMSAEKWNQTLEQDVSAVDGRDRVTIHFEESDREYSLRCTTVGVNEAPDVDPVALSDSARGDEPGVVNPFEDVRFVGATIPDEGDQNETVEAEFENLRDSDVNITEARFTFYSTDSQGAESPDRDPPETAYYKNEDFEVLGKVESVNGDVIPGDGSKKLVIRFEDRSGDAYDVREGDWFVLFLRFNETSGGESFGGTYFIPPVGGDSGGDDEPGGRPNDALIVP